MFVINYHLSLTLNTAPTFTMTIIEQTQTNTGQQVDECEYYKIKEFFALFFFTAQTFSVTKIEWRPGNKW